MPGIGAISGAVLNVTFMNRVDVTARRVFQERRLRDAGKVREIEPAEAPPRVLASGLAGALGRLAYSGCYYVGFGAALPFYAAAAVIGPRDNALARGIRDGAAAAARGAERSLDRRGPRRHPRRRDAGGPRPYLPDPATGLPACASPARSRAESPAGFRDLDSGIACHRLGIGPDGRPSGPAVEPSRRSLVTQLPSPARFPTTHWSRVARAGDPDARGAARRWPSSAAPTGIRSTP